jgi:hypothetical protein
LGCFASCKVTGDVFGMGPVGKLVVNRYEPVRLDGRGKVQLSMQMSYQIVEAAGDIGPFKITTVGWIYHLADSRGHDLFGYHWHPISDSHAKNPHFHNYAEGDKRHYPTGRVLIEEVLELAREYGAKPKDGIKWDDIAAENREKFEISATWGTSAG